MGASLNRREWWCLGEGRCLVIRLESAGDATAACQLGHQCFEAVHRQALFGQMREVEEKRAKYGYQIQFAAGTSC